MKKVYIARETAPEALRTEDLQRLIDRCAEEGGGQVRLMAGAYVSGTLYLKSGVELYLDAGAVLRGSADWRDYSNRCPQPTMVEGVPHWYNALITAVDTRDVAILGEGMIDGVDCLDRGGEQGFRGPHAVFFYNCDNVRVQGVSVVRAACYALMFEQCRGIRVTNVSIYGGQDGLRFGACRDAEVRGCDIRSGDDCIGGSGNADVRIYDTALNTPGGAVLQFSSKKLHVKNCVFWATGLYPAVFRDDKRYSLSYMGVCAGMNYLYPEGEDSDDWLFEDVRFENVELLFRYEKDMYGRKNIPLHRVVFDRVEAVNLVFPCQITGEPDCPIDLTIKNSAFECAEGDGRCERLFFRGSDFAALTLENVALSGYTDRPFELERVGSVTLRNVRVDRRLTGACLDGVSAGRVTVEPGEPATHLGRFVKPGVTSLYLPGDASEAFRGPLPWIAKPERWA